MEDGFFFFFHFFLPCSIDLSRRIGFPSQSTTSPSPSNHTVKFPKYLRTERNREKADSREEKRREEVGTSENKLPTLWRPPLERSTPFCCSPPGPPQPDICPQVYRWTGAVLKKKMMITFHAIPLVSLFVSSSLTLSRLLQQKCARERSLFWSVRKKIDDKKNKSMLSGEKILDVQ